MSTKELLNLYQKAINEIDDYFEYMFESVEDRDAVLAILDKLRENISVSK